jgi:anaerobic magnesium-protoporphyrin IX monomethyl ester cyclase
MYAVILTIPRVAALRPAAAPAIIKSIFNSHNLSSRVLDINLDYFTSFKDSIETDVFNEIDEFLFIKNKILGPVAKNFFEEFINSWINKIITLSPQKLFISVFSWQAQKFVEEFLKIFKQKSNIEVIVGGQGLIREENGSYSVKPTFAHYLKQQGLIDHWIRGEAETTIPEIIKGNYLIAGIDTDFLAERSVVQEHLYMDFSDFDITKYQSGFTTGVLPMETSRGCVRTCVFCDIPTMAGGFRFKRGDRLADEMIHYYETYGVRNYFFHDALCNGSVRDFRQFNQLLVEYYRKHNLPDRFFTYSSHAIVHSKKAFKPADFKAMAAAGAETMVIGVETGSDRVRVDMQKGFTTEDLDYNMEQYSKNKMQVYLLIVVGFPTETDQDFQDTLDMLTRYQRYVADGTIIGVNLGTTLTIEEGTSMYENPDKLKIIGLNENRPKGSEWMCKDNPTLTYKKRIMRRIAAQDHAVNLGYTFWKGDDQMKVLMDKYQERLAKLAGVIH